MTLPMFKPILPGTELGDRLVRCVGAALGIGLTMLVCAHLRLGSSDLPIIVAPLGASAVLAFAVPASPLAQPWPVIGGNVVSTLVGVVAFWAIPDIMVAAGVAVGGAILAMTLLRCLHPPGGAAALTAVIGSQDVHAAGFSFAVLPVGLNSLALVALAMLFHRLTDHAYPHRQKAGAGVVEAKAAESGLHAADIDAALADMHESFDIGREDLALLLSKAERHAAERRAGR